MGVNWAALVADFIIRPTLFYKGEGVLLSPPSVRLSVRPSVMLSPPKPLGGIQPKLGTWGGFKRSNII